MIWRERDRWGETSEREGGRGRGAGREGGGNERGRDVGKERGRKGETQAAREGGVLRDELRGRMVEKEVQV